MIAKRLRIEGRVQGVFYRSWTVETARSLGLNGWVRNRTDGSVEAYVVGAAESIVRLIELCYEGPATARVTSVVADDAAVEPFDSFEQRPTG